MSQLQVKCHSPLSVKPVELIGYVQSVAREVASGRYPFIEYDERNRWHRRIYQDDRVDLWLISWMPTQGTQLHDHGGSGGAFTVVSGTLTEITHRPGGGSFGFLRERTRDAGCAVGFNARYVHDVTNNSNAPAVSVHAYSPPLETMNYYDLTDDGALTRIATLATDDPEDVPDSVSHRPARRSTDEAPAA